MLRNQDTRDQELEKERGLISEKMEWIEVSMVHSSFFLEAFADFLLSRARG